MDRTILHIHMNSFYASVECLYHPEISEKPVAVVGDAEQRHGIILAKNQHAKNTELQRVNPSGRPKQNVKTLSASLPIMTCMKYTIRVCGQQRYLWLEDKERWFVEAPSEVKNSYSGSFYKVITKSPRSGIGFVSY